MCIHYHCCKDLILFSCESETRLCSGSTEFDSQSEEEIGLWHSVCDKETSLKPTTPVLSSITQPAQATGALCTGAVADACLTANNQQECSLTANGPAQISSCSCEPLFLSQAFTCSYLGNLTCFRTTAATESLPGYGYCSNFGSVIGGLVSTLVFLQGSR
jgi:hypothetical protein